MRLIEGRNPVLEAIKSDIPIDCVYADKEANGSLKKILSEAKNKGLTIKYVDKDALNRITENGRHQGIIAQALQYEYKEIDDIFATAADREEKPFVVILDEITDVHNLGAIIRTAEVMGAHGVIIPKRRAAQVNGVVSKTSAGAVEYIPVVRVTNISRTIQELKDRGLWIFGADMCGDKYLCEENFNIPLAIIIGSEGKGINRLVRDSCDALVKIPMNGKVTSLNASCAASVIIYEVMRQRGL